MMYLMLMLGGPGQGHTGGLWVGPCALCPDLINETKSEECAVKSVRIRALAFRSANACSTTASGALELPVHGAHCAASIAMNGEWCHGLLVVGAPFMLAK
jgi:hypothetical protein